MTFYKPLSRTITVIIVRKQAPPFVIAAGMSRPSNYTEFLIQKFTDFPPDKVAVVDYPSGRCLTYSQLKSQVISVASALRKHGFDRGQFLTHFGANCLENIPLVFGAMGAGGSLNFVKPSASKDELAVNLTQVRPRIVITTSEYLVTLQSAIELSGVDVDEVFIVGEPAPGCRSARELLGDPGDASPIGNLEIDDDEDVAMMLQTGGTTRMSKSVMVTHKGLHEVSKSLLYFFRDDDIILSFPPISYVSAIIGAFMISLTRGATVVSMPKFDPDSICIAAEKHKVTGTLGASASVLGMIRSPEFQRRDLSSLKWIIWAGSPISKELEDFVKSEFRGKAPSLFFAQKFTDFPPDKVAVVDYPSGRCLTYSQLKSQVISVASALRKHGFDRGQFLTHFGANCLENIPLVFGAMGAGGSLNFVKPSASKDELAVNLTQVRPRIVITTSEYLATLQSAIELCGVDVDEVFIVGEPAPGCRSARELLDDPGDASPIGNLEIDEDEDVAMMLQTGGTTRMSKSVMATHKALQVVAYSPFSFYRDDDVVLSFPPISYVSAIKGAYIASLNRGATVVSMPKFDPEAICIAIEKHKVTAIIMSPATVSEMLATPEFQKRDLRSLRWILCGGAPMNEDLHKFAKSQFQKKAPGVVFAQVFGMTEVLGIATWVVPERAPKPGSVGVVLPFVEAKVVNPLDEDEVNKPNQPGHIFLKSSAIMKGYFKNEEMTAKAFRNGWYRTEDYGWIDEDGYLFIMDRIDELIINKNGVIIPSTLEAIIQSHPKVKECVILAKNIEGDKWPIAFVVSDGDVTGEEIKDFVADRVEPYSQLKGGVRFVDNIPKSYAGKLLRKCFNAYLE